MISRRCRTADYDHMTAAVPGAFVRKGSDAALSVSTEGSFTFVGSFVLEMDGHSNSKR